LATTQRIRYSAKRSPCSARSGPATGAVSFAEMARRSGVARLLHQLATHGAIELSDEGVRLGMRLFEIGHLAARPGSLREAATPFLSDLFRATGETVHLAVADGDDVIYVHKLDGRLGPALGSRAGVAQPRWERPSRPRHVAATSVRLVD
jgi:IclR family transcriptional regulator, acetate operon repressor